MAFLFEKIDALREAGHICELPEYIRDNLNKNFVLRDYQIRAFENFITYFENPGYRKNPSQTLFHMATGSGKTLIMAGLMLYLYKQGYRNFIFFVHLNTIIEKTKDNFTNTFSSKYLFSNELIIDSEKIRINIVDNFQNTDDKAINICFTSIQGLHSAISEPKENGLLENDFDENKVVFISDESHHLNVDTKKKLNKADSDYLSWEGTLNRLFEKNNQNVLLQFTATCGIEDPAIKNKYENKIIFDYPLRRFYIDKFSKEINSLKTDKNTDIFNRVFLALILSQYRLKVFQDNRILVKPVVLLKSKFRDECKDFQLLFHKKIKNLTADDLKSAIDIGQENPIVKRAIVYFEKKNLTYEDIVSELKNDFSEEHCISANDDDAERNQLLLNSLEDKTNPYRVVFEVKKLDEGWDVLNLFDIVRLYSDRQPESGHKTSKFTSSEAQLIGRGARYCPFKTKDYPDDDLKFKRKFDSDTSNDLKICEELFYHCQNDSRYITELRKALNEVGLKDEPTYVTYKLKDSFKNDTLYKNGKIFFNIKNRKSREKVTSIPSNIFGLNNYSFVNSIGSEKLIEEEKSSISQFEHETIKQNFTIKEISEINYSIVHKSMRLFPNLRFNVLKRYFPNIKTMNEFIVDSNYLGNVSISLSIPSKQESSLNQFLVKACKKTFEKLSKYISNIEYDYEGSKEFKFKKLSDLFNDKTISLSEITPNGLGDSQKNSSEDSLDLSTDGMDWFVYNDNYGTSEEKSFVKYFYDNYLSKLKREFEKVFLIRNERSLAIYSFDNGERFEPDYILLLQNTDEENSVTQFQIFIEPKGTHLIDKDKWKQDFLLDLHDKATLLSSDANYNIWGVKFYNRDTICEFKKSFDDLCDKELLNRSL